MSTHNKTRVIAFHLPQYHPIPENDEWWGKGFTEWTNVVKAKPLFRGHYQPHLPADLGFYDLRLAESRQAQAELAQKYDLFGFCYYHYWFQSRRILDRPVREMLRLDQPHFPFCLCWANENWTRRWDGQDRQVLLQQSYSAQDDIDHIRELIPTFHDPRYIRMQGKPLFLIYRASQLPDVKATVDRWHNEAIKGGLPGLYLCRVARAAEDHGDPRPLGFDAEVRFEPDPMSINRSMAPPRSWYITRPEAAYRVLTRRCTLYHYPALVRQMIQKLLPEYPSFPCVFPGWDNSPRRQSGADIFVNTSPDLYAEWLKSAIHKVQKSGRQEPLVFINAWNEWAEGCHLEPDHKYGHAWLEATQQAINSASWIEKDCP